MPLGKLLSEYEMGLISGLKSAGMSNRDIATSIGRSSTVVDNYVKNPENYGQNHRGGRPKAISIREKRKFLRDVSNTGLSINQIRGQNGITASKTTCWRLCNEDHNLVFSKMKRTPKLKPVHIENRLNWAKTHMSWTEEWHKIIFSDEKKFNLDGPDGLKYYWHDLRKEPKWFSKQAAGGGSVMVWAGVGYEGKTDLVIIDQKNNGDRYVEMLEKHLIPFTDRIIGQNWTLQQDNSSVHTSKRVQMWFESKGIQVMSWPSLSPEFNIIENVWGQLVRTVYANGRQYSSTEELKFAIFESWEELSQTYIKTLVNSMPNRVFQLILKNGHKINY